MFVRLLHYKVTLFFPPFPCSTFWKEITIQSVQKWEIMESGLSAELFRILLREIFVSSPLIQSFIIMDLWIIFYTLVYNVMVC